MSNLFQIIGSHWFSAKTAIRSLYQKINAKGETEWSAFDNQHRIDNELLSSTCEPIDNAINMFGERASRLGLMLYDEDNEDGRKKIEDKELLDKYYNFLINKYTTQQSYGALMRQIITNILVHNEFFLQIKYHTSSDTIVSIKLIPNNLCKHQIGEKYYIKSFLVSPNSRNMLEQEEYETIKPGENIYKLTKVNGATIGKKNIESYLLHYYKTNPLSLSLNLSRNTINREMEMDFRGYNPLSKLVPLVVQYNTLSNQFLKLSGNIRTGFEVFGASNAKQTASVYSDKTKAVSTVLNDEEIGRINQAKNNGFAVSPAYALENAYKYHSFDTDLRKTAIPVFNMMQESRRQIFEAMGVPQRIITIEGSAYNNLIVAEESFEENCLTTMYEISSFLTQCVRFISPNFLKQNYAYTIDHSTSKVIMKKKEQEVKILTNAGAAAPNEAREIVNKAPIEGGDDLPTEDAAKPAKELTPEEAAKQKRNTGRNGDRVVNKKK